MARDEWEALVKRVDDLESVVHPARNWRTRLAELEEIHDDEQQLLDAVGLLATLNKEAKAIEEARQLIQRRWLRLVP